LKYCLIQGQLDELARGGAEFESICEDRQAIQSIEALDSRADEIGQQVPGTL
jgi:hypothetical protein